MRKRTIDGRRSVGPWALGTLVLAPLIGLLATAAAPVQDDDSPEQVEEARSKLEKYVETRRLISKERADWAVGKELLEERVELVQREIESLRKRIEDAKGSIAEADRKRAELVEENELLKQDSLTLEETIVALEGRTRELLPRLPEWVQERVKLLSQRLPEEDVETKLSLSERFQNVVGILNQLNRYNREITPITEVRTLADGSSVEVTTIYVGLGQAYYASVTGEAAGTGEPGEDGWVWTESSEHAAAIAEAIAIVQGDVAAFVHLPVRIR